MFNNYLCTSTFKLTLQKVRNCLVEKQLFFIITNRLECSYKGETCESQAERCLTCPLNSLCILDSVKGFFCPGEYYDKEDQVFCQNGKAQDNCLTCDSLAKRDLKIMNANVNHIFQNNLMHFVIIGIEQYECVNSYENCMKQ
ncbi:unnamed protein product [Paramecium primaurelia]|uniref:Uncharacterized protein n=1 Tax=Paramecium primaurelia TaxID=5886 RepID=A0A8S1NP05_PARPR|nr:unnamed protein product [Paramecium primaurelia]